MLEEHLAVAAGVGFVEEAVVAAVHDGLCLLGSYAVAVFNIVGAVGIGEVESHLGLEHTCGCLGDAIVVGSIPFGGKHVDSLVDILHGVVIDFAPVGAGHAGKLRNGEGLVGVRHVAKLLDEIEIDVCAEEIGLAFYAVDGIGAHEFRHVFGVVEHHVGSADIAVGVAPSEIGRIVNALRESAGGPLDAVDGIVGVDVLLRAERTGKNAVEVVDGVGGVAFALPEAGVGKNDASCRLYI